MEAKSKRKFTFNRSTAAFLAFTALCSSAASASIISVSSGPGNTGGTLTVISPPSTVGSNFNINLGLGPVVAFNEQQNVTLASTMITDNGSPIAAGTVVNSAFFSADSNAGGNGPFTITFNGPVLGIVFLDSSANFAETDFLGAPGTTYTESTCAFCGFEAGDTATFSGNTATLNPSFSIPGDMARIITAAPTSSAPEPAAWVLLLAALSLALVRFAPRAWQQKGRMIETD